MGDLIPFPDRTADRGCASAVPAAAFVFDVSCPLSYLAAERVERRLGTVNWVAADGSALSPAPAWGDDLRSRAKARARALGLPLVWPENVRARFPGAQRCAAYACERGAGAGFSLAAGRLAFCGGYDLEDREVLAEAAAAAGLAVDLCVAAAYDDRHDRDLALAAGVVRAVGLTELPAIRVGGRWYPGEAGLTAARGHRRG